MKSKFLHKTSFLFISLVLFLTPVFAVDSNLNLSNSEIQKEVEVGQYINLTLNVNPKVGTPIYTVSSVLKYDPEMLEFIDSSIEREWFSLPDVNDNSNKIENGLIVRSAGFSSGLYSNKKFLVYKFKAKSLGIAKIKVENPDELNINDSDSESSQNILTFNIVDELSRDNMDTNFSLSLTIKGDTAIYKQEPYNFKVYKKSEVFGQDAVSKIWVFDEGSDIYFEDERNWNTSKDVVLNFTIPANTLEEGNYKIIVKTRYANGLESVDAEKDVGVLSNGKSWFSSNKEVFFPILAAVIFFAIIHHFFTEIQLYQKMTSLKKRVKKSNKNKSSKR